MQITAEDFCKQVDVLFINSEEWYMTFVESDDGNPYPETVIEFQDKIERYGEKYLPASHIIEVDDQGQGVFELKDAWGGDDIAMNFEAKILIPFNKTNRAKRALGAL